MNSYVRGARIGVGLTNYYAGNFLGAYTVIISSDRVSTSLLIINVITFLSNWFLILFTLRNYSFNLYFNT